MAKHLFPIQINVISFNCNGTSLNDMLTKIGMVAYFELLFLFLEKCRSNVSMKKRSCDDLLQKAYIVAHAEEQGKMPTNGVM